MSIFSNIASGAKKAVSKVVSTVKGAFGQTPQLGTIYTKPGENVGKLPKGITAVTPTGTAMSQVPTGNIQNVINQPGFQPNLTQPQPIPFQPTPQQTQTQAIRAGNTLSDDQLKALGAPDSGNRPKMINSLTGKEMYAPQLTEEEANVFSSYNLKSTATAVGGALGVSAIGAGLSTASAALVSIQSYFTSIGTIATTEGGPEILASTIPEAAGMAPEWVSLRAGEVAGEVVVNTATKTSLIKFITSIPLGGKLATVGGLLTMAGITANGKTKTRKDVSDYVKDSGEQALKLRQSGMTKEADDLYASNKDLLDGLDTLSSYIPYFGTMIQEDKIQDYRDTLNKYNIQYIEQKAIDDRTYDILKQAADRQYAAQLLAQQRAYLEQQQAEQRRYAEQQQEEQRAYNEAQQQEQRQYNEQQAALQAQVAYATATGSEPATTLGFGLLRTPGGQYLLHKGATLPDEGTAVTDTNEISNYLFGIPYAQLTDVQKQLVDMMAGG